MIHDKHIKKIVDYVNAKDCFPTSSISGGVCFFLIDKNYKGDCQFKNVRNGEIDEMLRPLDEFDILVRYNSANSIIRKILGIEKKFLPEIMSPLMPFGLNANYRGIKDKISDNQLSLYASDGITYINPDEISAGWDYVDKFKVMLSKTSAEHAGEPSNEGNFKVLTSSMKILKPKEVCTHSYFLIGCFDEQKLAENVISYLKTKFLRFLVLISLSSINVSKLVFNFVPMQDFSKSWTDEELYLKYGLSDSEIEFIESMIKPMN
jgi:site-specific DNA-methyltransferase (adenine-specific)